MPDVAELGRKVKAKYPGAYDDLPDVEVGRKVKAKYPGAYDDFTDSSFSGVKAGGSLSAKPSKQIAAKAGASASNVTPIEKVVSPGVYFAERLYNVPGAALQTLRGGAEDVRRDVNKAAAVATQTQEHVAPGGFFGGLASKLRRSDPKGSGVISGKIAASTLSALDPSMLPAFVKAITEKGGGKKAVEDAKGLFSKVATGTPEEAEQAAADLMGMLNAFGIGMLGGGNAIKGLLKEKPVNLHVTDAIGYKDAPKPIRAKEFGGKEFVAETNLPPVEKGPASFSSKTVPQKNAFGLATRFEPDGSRPKSGVSVDEIAERGKQVLAKDAGAARRAYMKVQDGSDLSPDEISAVAARGAQIRNRFNEIDARLDDANLSDIEKDLFRKEADDLELEMGQVLDAGTSAQKTFHQTGQALQVAFGPDFSRVGIVARAKRMGHVDPEMMTELEARSTRIADLEKELGGLRNELEDALSKIKAKTKAGSKDAGARRTSLVDGLLKDFGLKPGQSVSIGKTKSKQVGGLDIPEGFEKRVSDKANALARVYLEGGAQNLDDVLNRFAEDLPDFDRDTVLGLLSGQYRKKLLESDVHKISVNRAMQKIRNKAEFERKTLYGKAASIAGDTILATQRGMQAGLDASFAFLQGLPGGIAAPSKWASSWKETLSPLTGGQEGYRQTVAKLQRDPAYKRAVKAGVSFTDVDGPITVQEEAFMGNLVERVRDWAKKEGANKIGKYSVGLYAEALGRSNEMYAAFLNKQRMELFKKFSGGKLDDSDTLRDAARLVNIVTGRGDGKMASALANKNFALAFYAPRYMLSTYQNAALPFLLPTFKTGQGKAAAMSVWAKQAAAAYGSLEIAKRFGLQVDDDLRSQDYGTIKLPGGQTVNVFKKIVEPVKIAAQMYGGQISTKDEYKEAGFYNGASVLGRYLLGKASPVGKVAINQTFGERFDGSKGMSEPFNLFTREGALATSKEAFVPLAWQQAAESEGDASAFITAFFGLDVKPQGKKIVPKSLHPIKRP